MSKLEGIFYKIFAQNLIKFTLAVCPIVFKGFVNNIPTFYTTFVATYNSINVLTHTFFQNFRRYVFPIFIHKHPSTYLRMPDKEMAGYNLFVFFSKSYKFISVIPNKL